MKKTLRASPPDDGFTRLDLLVLFVVAGLWFLTLLPALARTKTDSRAFQCLNNHRQLARAMRMYADDNNDRMTVHGPGFSVPTYPIWAAGWLDWGSSSDNTNTVFLTDPRYSSLSLYDGRNARLFKCPMDQFVSTLQRARGWNARVRSVAANPYAGENRTGISIGDAAYNPSRKWSELVNPRPADTWLAFDEHPDSINDSALIPPNIGQWIDLPANYHAGGAGGSFADGRAEIHRWQSSVLTFPVSYSTFSSATFPVNDPDILWLRYRTPRKPGMN